MFDAVSGLEASVVQWRIGVRKCLPSKEVWLRLTRRESERR
jgi:hypothetical protein